MSKIQKKKTSSWLSPDQVQEVIDILPELSCYESDCYGRKPLEPERFQLLTKLCYDAALRINEGVTTKPFQLDVQKGLMNLPHTKSGFYFCDRCAETEIRGRRKVLKNFNPRCRKCNQGKIYYEQHSFITTSLMNQLVELIHYEEIKKNTFIFRSPSFPTNHISERWCLNQYKEAGKMLGLNIFKQYRIRQITDIYTHIFRRSKAKQMEADGFLLSEIQQKLRHRNIKTTSTYLEADLGDVINKEREMYG